MKPCISFLEFISWIKIGRWNHWKKTFLVQTRKGRGRDRKAISLFFLGGRGWLWNMTHPLPFFDPKLPKGYITLNVETEKCQKSNSWWDVRSWFKRPSHISWILLFCIFGNMYVHTLLSATHKSPNHGITNWSLDTSTLFSAWAKPRKKVNLKPKSRKS